MKMTKLATLFLTATLSLASGAALAADSGAQTNNGQANAAADAGQVAPDAREMSRQITSIIAGLIATRAAPCCTRTVHQWIMMA